MSVMTREPVTVMFSTEAGWVPAAAGTQPASVENITVTGSRVITDIANSPTPITAVSSDQLLTTTPTNIADGLNKLPIFQNSGSNRSLSCGGGNSSGDFLNLRNFGQRRTLVL